MAWPDQEVTSTSIAAANDAALDLAVAVAVLAVSGQIPAPPSAEVMLLGELGLDGRLRPVRDVAAPIRVAIRAGITFAVVPAHDAPEAACTADASGVTVVPAATLAEVVAWLENRHPIDHVPVPARRFVPDLADIAGNDAARWALEVCAAGGHNLFLVGAGPTVMFAERLPGIVPSVEGDAAREVAEIRAMAGLGPPERRSSPDGRVGVAPPFVAPHHTATLATVTGSPARPGMVSLAHRGVLHLANAAEFSRHVFDALRMPVLCGRIRVANSRDIACHPARFQLVLSTSACPCASRTCDCTSAARSAYLDRLAEPLQRVEIRALVDPQPTVRVPGESSAVVADRVRTARDRARARLTGTPWLTNAEIPRAQLRRFDAGPEAVEVLDRAHRLGLLSVISYPRLLRVAWTLADLRGANRPTAEDATGALDLWKGADNADG
jgi:magnesium chelatase family protein